MSHIASGTDALLVWAQKQTNGYKGVKIKNWGDSWVDGLAFCALVHSYRPDLIPFDELKTETRDDKLRNLELAFKAAESLGIDQLMDPPDLVDFGGERFSLMTYLSGFYEVLKKLPSKRQHPAGEKEQPEVELQVRGGLLGQNDKRKKELEKKRKKKM